MNRTSYRQVLHVLALPLPLLFQPLASHPQSSSQPTTDSRTTSKATARKRRSQMHGQWQLPEFVREKPSNAQRNAQAHHRERQRSTATEAQLQSQSRWHMLPFRPLKEGSATPASQPVDQQGPECSVLAIKKGIPFERPAAGLWPIRLDRTIRTD